MPTKRALDGGIKVAWEGEGGVDNGLFSLMTPFITRKNAGFDHRCRPGR